MGRCAARLLGVRVQQLTPYTQPATGERSKRDPELQQYRVAYVDSGAQQKITPTKTKAHSSGRHVDRKSRMLPTSIHRAGQVRVDADSCSVLFDRRSEFFLVLGRISKPTAITMICAVPVEHSRLEHSQSVVAGRERRSLLYWYTAAVHVNVVDFITRCRDVRGAADCRFGFRRAIVVAGVIYLVKEPSSPEQVSTSAFDDCRTLAQR